MDVTSLESLLTHADGELQAVLLRFLGAHRGRPSLCVGTLACELLRSPGAARLLPAERCAELARQAEQTGLADAGAPAGVVALLRQADETAAQLLTGKRSVTVALLLRCLVASPSASGDKERRLQLLLSEAGISGFPAARPVEPTDVRYQPLGYGTDLTRLMQGTPTPPLIGRRDELGRVMKLLIAGRNPVLTGEPGVGKSALIEGLAWLLTHPTGDVPAELQPLQIVSVQVSDLVADSGVQGALEKRLNGFIEHLEKNPNVVPFIDEIHALLAGGKAAGQVIIDTLKSKLARPGLRIMGATTDREYQRYFLSERALRERFRDVYLTEPSRAEATDVILQRGSSLFSEPVRRRGIGLSAEAVGEAVRLASENFKESRLPRMAIELLREAAGGRAYQHALRPDQPPPPVTPADVAEVAASRLGLPADSLTGDAGRRARRVREALAGALVGQEAACAAILEGLALNFAGLAEPGRPPSVMLYHGPRGTGKSTAAATLAGTLTGGGQSLFTLSMPDFQEEGARNRLVGASPGYRDSGDTWTVFAAVRSRPASVVVLDGIESVPGELVRPLSAMMRGQASDGMGHPTDFSQCHFVLVAGGELCAALDGAANARAVMARYLGADLAGLVEHVVPFAALDRDAGREILSRRLAHYERSLPAGDSPTRAVLASLGRADAADELLDQAQELGGDGHAVLAALRAALGAGCWRHLSQQLDTLPEER